MNFSPVALLLLVASCVLVGVLLGELDASHLVRPGHRCHGEALVLAFAGERWERCW